MEENTLQSNCDEDESTKVSMRNTNGIRIYGSSVFSNCHMYKSSCGNTSECSFAVLEPHNGIVYAKG